MEILAVYPQERQLQYFEKVWSILRTGAIGHYLRVLARGFGK